MQKTGIPYGSDASAGTYRCDDCGHEIAKPSNTSLQPCPKRKGAELTHVQNSWTALTGQGDAEDDPYPDN